MKCNKSVIDWMFSILVVVLASYCYNNYRWIDGTTEGLWAFSISWASTVGIEKYYNRLWRSLFCGTVAALFLHGGYFCIVAITVLLISGFVQVLPVSMAEKKMYTKIVYLVLRPIWNLLVFVLFAYAFVLVADSMSVSKGPPSTSESFAPVLCTSCIIILGFITFEKCYTLLRNMVGKYLKLNLDVDAEDKNT